MAFWLENGQVAATGRYEHDRKTSDWEYWAEDGGAMPYQLAAAAGRGRDRARIV